MAAITKDARENMVNFRPFSSSSSSSKSKGSKDVEVVVTASNPVAEAEQEPASTDEAEEGAAERKSGESSPPSYKERPSTDLAPALPSSSTSVKSLPLRPGSSSPDGKVAVREKGKMSMFGKRDRRRSTDSPKGEEGGDVVEEERVIEYETQTTTVGSSVG